MEFIGNLQNSGFWLVKENNIKDFWKLWVPWPQERPLGDVVLRLDGTVRPRGRSDCPDKLIIALVPALWCRLYLWSSYIYIYRHMYNYVFTYIYTYIYMYVCMCVYLFFFFSDLWEQ